MGAMGCELGQGRRLASRRESPSVSLGLNLVHPRYPAQLGPQHTSSDSSQAVGGTTLRTEVAGRLKDPLAVSPAAADTLGPGPARNPWAMGAS